MSWLNTVRSAASTAASYIPGVSYFSGETAAPAGTTATNTTRRNNRNAPAPAPGPAPIATASMTAVPAGASSAPALAPVAAREGGGSIRNRIAALQTKVNAAKAAANKDAAIQARLRAGTAHSTNWSSPEAMAKSAREAAEFNRRQAARTAELMAAAKAKAAGEMRRRRATRRHRKAGRR